MKALGVPLYKRKRVPLVETPAFVYDMLALALGTVVLHGFGHEFL